MEKFHDFIKRVFDEQYEVYFGPDMLEKLEPRDYYLTREKDGRLIALLHGQQVLENIHIKALVVDKAYQKKGLGASLLEELEEKAAEEGVTSITLSTVGSGGWKALGDTDKQRRICFLGFPLFRPSDCLVKLLKIQIRPPQTARENHC